jgi:DNA-binding beta-propeller fold protein YncE
MKNSDGSGIAIDFLNPGGIMVADEATNTIARIDLSSLTSSPVSNIPWVMNPLGNGTGQQHYAADQNPKLLYFWDNTRAMLFRLDRSNSPNAPQILLARDQGIADGLHVTTGGNHVVFDSATFTLLLTDGSSNSVLEVNSTTGAFTTLFSGLPGTPRAIALDSVSNQVFVQVGNSIYVGPRSGGLLSLLTSGFTSLTDIVIGKSTSGMGLSLFAVDRALNTVYEIPIS